MHGLQNSKQPRIATYPIKRVRFFGSRESCILSNGPRATGVPAHAEGIRIGRPHCTADTAFSEPGHQFLLGNLHRRIWASCIGENAWKLFPTVWKVVQITSAVYRLPGQTLQNIWSREKPAGQMGYMPTYFRCCKLTSGVIEPKVL